MKIFCETDVLWPTRVKITFDGLDVWVTTDAAKTLRDQLTSILTPPSLKDLAKISKYMNEEYDV